VRRTLTVATILALALALAPLLVAPAGAEPPNPNHHVIEVLGRRLVAYNHYGDPNRGHVVASAQGELVDTNFNGLANAIRGRGALLEDHGVERFRMYSISLQRFRAETWETVAFDGTDVVSSGQPSYLVNYTPAAGYCVGFRPILTYRVIHRDAIRWIDGTVGTRTTVSSQFQARMVASDPDCPDLP
jgi:hypothetical protein